MMDVGKVRVAVRQRLMRMLVRVRLDIRTGTLVRMAMVLVVHVPMAVGQWFVPVAVLVALGEMQP